MVRAGQICVKKHWAQTLLLYTCTYLLFMYVASMCALGTLPTKLVVVVVQLSEVIILKRESDRASNLTAAE